MNEETRNLILMVGLSLAILFGFQYFFPQEAAQTPEAVQVEQAAGGQEAGATQPVVEKSGAVSVQKTVEPKRVPAKRIEIRSPVLSGSLSTRGGRVDRLSLLKYSETQKKQNPVQLLADAGSDNPYYAEFGWVSGDAADDLPTSETVWMTEDTVLTPDSPVTLRWMNKKGVVFEKIISLDENYLFTLVERVENQSNDPLTLHQYGVLFRAGTPPVSEFFVSYEGPMGYLDSKKRQESYEDLMKAGKVTFETTSGWLGYSDKYWLGALIPDQETPMKASMSGSTVKDQKRYQMDYVANPVHISAGQTHQSTVHFYAGPKQLDLLDAYEKTLNVPHFDLAVDFGWFYFITKPIFYTLTFLHDWIGNFGLAIMALTVLMRLLFFPIANKSFRSMGKMKALQPEMARIKEMYADDKMKQQQETMALFKKYKVNPASGCVPMLIQIPVFFALYKVIFISIEMRHAPFYGWITDLSAKDPTNIFTLFGLINWAPPEFLNLGLLPLMMGGTMFLQQRLNPQPMDEAQKTVFMIMPIVFTFVMSGFPAGLLLYWTWTNILGMAQQSYIMKLNSSTEVLKEEARKKPRKKKA